MADVQTEVVAVPEEISFTETEMNAEETFELLPEGSYRLGVTTVRGIAKKDGDLTLLIECRAQDAEERPFGPEVTAWVTIPKANPNVPGHQAPKTYDVRKFAGALDVNFPKFAMYNSETKTFLTDSGDVVDSTAAKALKAEANKAARVISGKWWNNKDLLIDEMFYAQVYHNVSKKNGNTYANVRTSTLSATPPADETVKTSL